MRLYYHLDITRYFTQKSKTICRYTYYYMYTWLLYKIRPPDNGILRTFHIWGVFGRIITLKRNFRLPRVNTHFFIFTKFTLVRNSSNEKWQIIITILLAIRYRMSGDSFIVEHSLFQKLCFYFVFYFFNKNIATF